MRLPLFKVAFRNQWLSMAIYSLVIVLYGALIMFAYLSVVQGTLNDPNATVAGLTVTMKGQDSSDVETLNLTWETEAGVAYHTAIGIKDLSSAQHFMDPDAVQAIVDGRLDISKVEGVEVLYNGTGTFVEFKNVNGSTIFMVILVPVSGDPLDASMRGPVLTMDLKRTSDLDEFLEDNPMMKAFFGERFVDYTDPQGYLMLEYFTMWPLFFVIYIAVKAVSTVSKHVEDRSIDILLATGYSRERFLGEKLLLVLVNMAALVISALVGLLIGALMIGEAPPLEGSTYALVGSIPMCFAFVGISMVITVVVDESGKAVGAILGLIIFQYIIQIVSNIASWGSMLKYFSLFTYWDSLQLGLDHRIDAVDMVVPTVLGMALVLMSFILFRRKDIHA